MIECRFVRVVRRFLFSYFDHRTRSCSREEKRVDAFLEAGRETWVESSFDVEGPFFMSVLSLVVLPSSRWKEKKITFLKRLLIANHVRSVCGHFPAGGRVHDKSIQDWSVYKSAAIFWALLDSIYKKSFKVRFLSFLDIIILSKFVIWEKEMCAWR